MYQFYGRSKYGSFKIMLKEEEILNKNSSSLKSNLNFDSIMKFILRGTYNRPKIERTPWDVRYAKLFVKVKGNKREFSDTYWLPPDESSLKMKIKQAHYLTKGIVRYWFFYLFFHEKQAAKIMCFFLKNINSCGCVFNLCTFLNLLVYFTNVPIN